MAASISVKIQYHTTGTQELNRARISQSHYSMIQLVVRYIHILIRSSTFLRVVSRRDMRNSSCCIQSLVHCHPTRSCLCSRQSNSSGNPRCRLSNCKPIGASIPKRSSRASWRSSVESMLPCLRGLFRWIDYLWREIKREREKKIVERIDERHCGCT